MIGQTLGTYRIERELGRGGMGAVYAAVHTILGRRAAVKVLLAELSRNEQVVQRFFNEAKAATAIKHPSIVEIYDFGWAADGSAYIVMELMDGESLASRLKRAGRLPVATALHLARQIANALGAAHRAGIIHRDLKPDNVFLVPDIEVAGGERVKLLDFGIAKLTGALSGDSSRTKTGSIMGTPTYMSPEQCEGSREVDHRTDLYALGCMTFEMLSGRPPFADGGTGAIIAAHLLTPPPRLLDLVADVSPEVDALVARLLAKAAGDRVQTADEAAQAFGRLSGHASMPPGGVVASPSAPTLGVPSRLASTPGTPTTLSAAAAAGSVAGTAPPSGRGMWFALGAAGLVAAAIAALVIAGGGGGGGAGAGVVAGGDAPSAPPLDAGAIAVTSDASAGVDAASVDPLLEPARAALADRRWSSALSLAEDVLAQDPDHGEARAIAAAATRGQKASAALDVMEAAVSKKGWRAVRDAYDEVIEHSPPGDPDRAEADALLARARPPAIADARRAIEKDVKAARCDAARRRAADEVVAWGDAADELTRVAARCKATAVDGGVPMPPEPDPVPVRPDPNPGALGREQIKKVMSRTRSKFARCGEQHKLAGRVAARVTIGPSGTVTDATVAGGDGGAGDECIAQALRALQFPASTNPVTITWPIVFAAAPEQPAVVP